MEKSFVSLNYMSAETAKKFEQWRKVSQKAEGLYRKAVETIENEASAIVDFVNATCDFTDELEEQGLQKEDSERFQRALSMWFEDVKKEQRRIASEAPALPWHFANAEYWELIDEAREQYKTIPATSFVSRKIWDAVRDGEEFESYFEPYQKQEIRYAKLVNEICVRYTQDRLKEWKAYCEKKGYPEPKANVRFEDWAYKTVCAILFV